jgi:hypothetical protein
MRLIEFPGQTLVIAKDQPEYVPMPAHVAPDGTVTCRWRLSFRERIRVLLRGEVWHQVLTFGQPLQPQSLTVNRPMLIDWPRGSGANVHSLDAD